MARHKVIRSPRQARREQKRRIWKLVLLSILIFLAVSAAVYGFSRPELRIERIEVSGSVRVPEASVVRVVKEALSGTYLGFIPKSHTLLYPHSALTQSLLRTFPTFANVSLSLESLAALRVSVIEREPRALWCIGGQDCFLMDETGFVFAPAEAGTEGLYYRLETSATTTSLGTFALEKSRLAGFVDFLQQLERLGFDPEKLLLEEVGGLEVVFRDGMRLLLNNGDFERALTNLNALLAEHDLIPKEGGRLGVSYIDLRYGNKIYFKPR